jgi:large subunit ribosomal protein L7Ae
VIAHDVDPIELVVWLPALCRRMDVPYVIVKGARCHLHLRTPPPILVCAGKARLGHLVHKKTSAVVALTDVKKEHQTQLDQFVAATKPSFNDNVAERRRWGGGILGAKALAVERKKEKARAKELAGQK